MSFEEYRPDGSVSGEAQVDQWEHWLRLLFVEGFTVQKRVKGVEDETEKLDTNSNATSWGYYIRQTSRGPMARR